MTEEINDTPPVGSEALMRLLAISEPEELGLTISGVLEFLTMRALLDGPYYIQTDDKLAITVFAANDEAKSLEEMLPDTYKSWEEGVDEPDFLTNVDLGDEQDESTAEAE
jgi:hypothetical protein